jgi:phosphoribosyl-ATP pyrophosphohydrolase/phosphoribosyl-AMP cyclohydrolase
MATDDIASGDELAWGENGLLPVVIQDASTGAVLTLAHANREALERTLAERTTWLYSRSRATLWKKGETSGNTQSVVSVAYDCDADALLYRVHPRGPACHTGADSCFFREFEPAGDPAPGERPFADALAHLATTIAARRATPDDASYTTTLLRGGVDRIGKKIGEEATEVVIAAKNDDPGELVWEVADLFYHTLVLLEARGITLDDVGRELLRRAK